MAGNRLGSKFEISLEISDLAHKFGFRLKVHNFTFRDFSEIFQIFMTKFEIKILRPFVNFQSLNSRRLLCLLIRSNSRRLGGQLFVPGPRCHFVLVGVSLGYVTILWYFGKWESIGCSTCTAKNKFARKKTSGTKFQIMVQNILYHYLVVLNVKIRNSFFGHLRALGTVRIFWKYELNRVKTSHALWLNRSQKSSPENSFLPENSNFLDVLVNILRTRTSYRVPLSQACWKRPGCHVELPKFYIHPV